MSESAKYTVFGALFGLCFPIGSIAFLWLAGDMSLSQGLMAAIAHAHTRNPLLYVIDSAPLFLGFFARFAGVRQDRIRRFSEGLEQEVAEKTESLRRALDEAHKANEMIIHMAEHDALTGLLNRRRFQKELERWANHSARYRRPMAVMFIDMDRLKHINDTYGHGAGDSYLLVAAEVLQHGLRSTDFIARWGGDEFAVLLPETQAGAAADVANKLMDLFSAATTPVGGQNMTISASIGIALLPEHSVVANELIMFADAAMYEAKQCGRGCWRMYSASTREIEHLQEKMGWEGRIRRALEADQFLLLYQPLLNLRSNATHYYEALLRMEDRDGHLITPGMFLDSAEHFDLSIPIDRMVIRKVTHKLSVLSGHEPQLGLSVNLSRKTILDTTFMEYVGAAVAQSGVDPGRLGFEISERILLEDIGRARRLAGDIHDAGHDLIMDDFGAGLASFRYLQQLAPRMLKLEAGLLRELTHSSETRGLVKSLVAMAHDLGIAVAAKFVEDQEVLGVLAELEVDYAQGFAVGKPFEAIEQAALKERRIG
ncbi:MAG: putative bifunctional diguanylate cyclase/phosphodiesterase [Acidiferrobacterales bacterium]